MGDLVCVCGGGAGHLGGSRSYINRGRRITVLLPSDTKPHVGEKAPGGSEATWQMLRAPKPDPLCASETREEASEGKYVRGVGVSRKWARDTRGRVSRPWSSRAFILSGAGEGQ